jgi:hypothetical protein
MMTQDEVLKELRSVIATNQQFTTWTISTPHIFELVNRAIKQEREACAKVCDSFYESWINIHGRYEFMGEGAQECAAAIRARGQA